MYPLCFTFAFGNELGPVKLNQSPTAPLSQSLSSAVILVYSQDVKVFTSLPTLLQDEGLIVIGHHVFADVFLANQIHRQEESRVIRYLELPSVYGTHRLFR